MESKLGFFVKHLGSKFSPATVQWMTRGTSFEDHVSSCPYQTRENFLVTSRSSVANIGVIDELSSDEIYCLQCGWMKIIIVCAFSSGQHVKAENVQKFHEIGDVDRYIDEYVNTHIYL